MSAYGLITDGRIIAFFNSQYALYCGKMYAWSDRCFSDVRISYENVGRMLADEKRNAMETIFKLQPAVTMQIDSIPLNRNQKVDKRALPEPLVSAQSFAAASNGPLSMTAILRLPSLLWTP